MKTLKNRLKKIAIGSGALATLCLLQPIPVALAAPGLQLNDCTIRDTFDGDSGRESITLRTAVSFANRDNRANQRCRKSIKIEANEINLNAPLVIKVLVVSENNGAADEEEVQGEEPGEEVIASSESEEFVYRIEGKEGTPVRINASNLRNYSGSEQRKCVLIFRNTHDIKLKNIALENIPPGYDGICLENGVNSIEFEDVIVRQAEDGTGNGIVFDPLAYDNKISGNSTFDHIAGGSAIVDLGADITGNQGASQKFNQIIATNQPITGTGDDGLSTFGDPAGEVKKVSIFGIISGSFVSTSSPLRIRIEKIDQIGGLGSTEFRIEGSVVDVSESEDICEARPVSGSAQVRRLQIYSAQAGGAVSAPVQEEAQEGETAEEGEAEVEAETQPTVQLNEGAFYKYVMENTGVSGGNGIDRSGNSQGEFRFLIHTNETGTMIVMVPELDTNTIAGSSRVVSIVDEYTDCPDGFDGGRGRSGGIGDDEGGAFVGIQDYVLSEALCPQERNIGASGLPDSRGLDIDFDSDGDLIPDALEDTRAPACVIAGDFSYWNDPDSDDDGILDGKEIPAGFVPISPFNRHLITGDITTQFCARLSEDGTTLTLPPENEDPCDADNDGISNPLDDDSDNDGLLDYEEDRQKTLNPWAAVKLVDSKGAEWDCPSQLTALTYSRGQAWAVFRWKNGEAPVLHDFSNYSRESLPADTVLVRASCKNMSLLPSDFNGTVNGRTESDPYKADTDNDGVCDGNGTGCETCVMGPLGIDCTDMAKKEDNCPNEDDSENICALPCQDNEDLYRICNNPRNRTCADQYLVFEGNNPTALKDANNNNTADLYEVADWHQLYTICSDLDHDLIPDCAERMDPRCQASTQSAGALNPHKQDTDGDDVEDNIDLNPFADLGLTGSDGDEIDDVTASNRDSLRDELRTAQVALLRCFIDRDQDGLTDCEEDLDKQDDYDGNAATSDLAYFLEHASEVECDPLNPDTDSDGIDDKAEVTTIHTNCQNRDTDGDTLSDRAEVKGTERDPYTDQGSGRCSALPLISPNEVNFSEIVKTTPGRRIGTNPTDPDTDRDGIPDNVEITCINLTMNPAGLPNLLDDGLSESDSDVCSNPLSDDSDGDGLTDAQEYAKSGPDGFMSYDESSPCDTDTDSDGIQDNGPNPDACPTSNNPQCRSIGVDGPDSDGDGLSDTKEAALGTDSGPNGWDTDGDGLSDGEEVGADGIFNLNQGDTDPRCIPLRDDGSCIGLDTDLDGLTDGEEQTLGTYGNDPDSDHDCIPDGVETNFNVRSTFTGTDTNPTSPDTDGDGLCDGDNAQTAGGLTGDVTCIRGEDMDCDGQVDVSAENVNQFIETDPRNRDTDSDGVDDKTEVCSGGRCDLVANISRATQGASSGCLNLGGTAEGALPNMLFQLSGLFLLVWNRMRSRFKKS